MSSESPMLDPEEYFTDPGKNLGFFPLLSSSEWRWCCYQCAVWHYATTTCVYATSPIGLSIVLVLVKCCRNISTLSYVLISFTPSQRSTNVSQCYFNTILSRKAHFPLLHQRRKGPQNFEAKKSLLPI